MAHTRRSTWCSLRRLGPVRRCAILLRSGLRCAWCDIDLDQGSAQVDHVLPRARGGQDVNTNLIASCASCNAPAGRGVHRRRLVTPEIRAVLAGPVDLAAGLVLAREWYPFVDARIAANARRKREARAARSRERYGVAGGAAFPFGADEPVS